jgi:hypothetical protein
MKLMYSAMLAVLIVPFTVATARADESLGEVIGDNIRREIRDDIRDSIRRDICTGRERRNQGTDLCETLEDIDQVRDGLRRGGNAIRIIDAIFD